MLTPPEKKRPTQNVFGPDCSSMSATPLLKPLTIAPITITTITPIATPRIVSAARALWARSDSSAMPTPSSNGVTGSLLAQGGDGVEAGGAARGGHAGDRKSTRLNSSHSQISYAVFCLEKKKKE